MEHPAPATQVPAAVWRTIEILNSMSGESDDEHSKTNNSTLHDNHKGNHSLNTELSLHAPNCEAFRRVASTSAFKAITVVIGPRSVVSFISTALSVVCVFFLLLVLAAHLFTVALTASSNWPWRTMEKLNSKGSEEHRKTNKNLMAAANSSGRTMEKVIKMISNDNHKGDHIHSLNTSISSTASSQQSSSVTRNSSASAVFDCFNNLGGGKQDYSYTTIDNFTCTKSFNNKSSGLQAISNADICFSSAVDAFNNISTDTQTLRHARIHFVANSNQRNTSDNWVPANNVFNNNGYQKFDGFCYKARKGIIDDTKCFRSK